MTEDPISIGGVIGAICAIAIVVSIMILLPIKMAKSRGRSALGWVLLFWIVTPIWGIILLLIVGDSKQKLKKDILAELRRNQESDTEAK